ncbi:hypothetical protein CHGG_07138 [Chaetomium globosum CBS 148.51]|uniref:tRNA pseudouridine(55) synthase n=1 Tax=Chaetomium globosum (strain ATCC 6205 / CBS 148.51 / DSM 1962 / NBRC 6347 / NRRL 1970) TaxID=306901 RepID=Q2GY16_CHAGB|nr:uncharacterized protein CHGG_07138 [Chaetomium globosum CBS 148.51]EAQ85885.1 hypothetical protein CHGG_07138 [Chaetomium globosum CBS 148.51]
MATDKIVEGVFAINKPVGMSSAQIIRDCQHQFNPSALFAPLLKQEQALRDKESRYQKHRRGKAKRALQVKMGHGGTLDPLATGVLILGVGKGTNTPARANPFRARSRHERSKSPSWIWSNGEMLGCGAMMAELSRTRQGQFAIGGENCLQYDELFQGEDVWGPKVDRMLDLWNNPNTEQAKPKVGDAVSSPAEANETSKPAAKGNDSQEDKLASESKPAEDAKTTETAPKSEPASDSVTTKEEQTAAASA